MNNRFNNRCYSISIMQNIKEGEEKENVRMCFGEGRSYCSIQNTVYGRFIQAKGTKAVSTPKQPQRILHRMQKLRAASGLCAAEVCDVGPLLSDSAREALKKLLVSVCLFAKYQTFSSISLQTTKHFSKYTDIKKLRNVKGLQKSGHPQQQKVDKSLSTFLFRCLIVFTEGKLQNEKKKKKKRKKPEGGKIKMLYFLKLLSLLACVVFVCLFVCLLVCLFVCCCFR